MRTALSTVACPDWPLDRVVRVVADLGCQGLDLRTLGQGSTALACDPALTSPEKLRDMLGAAGLLPACVSTSLRFDAPINPPIIGRIIGDYEQAVRGAKWAIDLASRLHCPFVRVFAFEIPHGERYDSAVTRIVKRLVMVADHARNTGMRVVLENGGSFPRAADIAEIMDRVGSPLLGASYSMAVAHEAGEDPAIGANALGDRLWVARVKDHAGHRVVPLGRGDRPCEPFVRALAAMGSDAWIVYEWDRAWLNELAEGDDTETVLGEASRLLREWTVQPQPV